MVDNIKMVLEWSEESVLRECLEPWGRGCWGSSGHKAGTQIWWWCHPTSRGFCYPGSPFLLPSHWSIWARSPLAEEPHCTAGREAPKLQIREEVRGHLRATDTGLSQISWNPKKWLRVELKTLLRLSKEKWVFEARAGKGFSCKLTTALQLCYVSDCCATLGLEDSNEGKRGQRSTWSRAQEPRKAEVTNCPSWTSSGGDNKAPQLFDV